MWAAMSTLPRPLLPQLARSLSALPDGDGWAFEPKWDGFRAIAFVDGENVELQSRSGKDLTRYFPEVKLPPGSYVLDGELLVRGPDGREDFALISQRVHPAASRIERLSRPMVYEDYAARHLSNEQSWTTSDPHLLRHRFQRAGECCEAAAVEEDEADEFRLLMLD